LLPPVVPENNTPLRRLRFPAEADAGYTADRGGRQPSPMESVSAAGYRVHASRRLLCRI